LRLFRIAFIDFDTVEAAQSAMKNMNNKSLDGRKITIDYAETRDGGKYMLSMYVTCSGHCLYHSHFV